jgi:hypothetical protein
MTTLTFFVYNKDKRPVKEGDGITELPQNIEDSLVQRGKNLIDSLNYNERDLKAIAAYLSSR